MIRHRQRAKMSGSQRPLDTERVANEFRLGELDAVVQGLTLREEVFRERVEEVEGVEPGPRQRGCVTDSKARVGYPEPRLRATGDFDQVGPVLDADELDLGSHGRRDENEFSGTRAHIEHACGARIAQECCGAPCDGYRRPESTGHEPDR